MSDINLLPEDLKRKQDKILKNRGNFDLDEIEFTAGEKLKKRAEAQIKKPVKEDIKKWFKPKLNNQVDFKNRNKQPILRDLGNIKKIDNHLADNKIPQVPLKPQVDHQPDQNKKKVSGFQKFINSLILKLNKQKIKQKKKKKKKGLEVNLLPFGSNIPTTRRMIYILIITFILASSLIFVVYFGYYIYKEEVAKDYGNLENELDIFMKDIEKYDSLILEITAWQKKVDEIENLLNKHIYWTEFFNKLEENTLPNVQFNGFAGSIDSSVILQATAPNYQTISQQWIRLQNADDFVKRVQIGGASMFSAEDSIKISFSMTLDLAEGVFYKD